MRHTARNRWVVTGFTALSLIAASCGSDDKANDTTPAAVSSPPATAATTPPSSAPEATTGTSPSETEATEATAATVPPGDGSTVKIGFVNLEGGAVSLPELRIGAETAAHYVNGNGGANTHPLEIVPCNVD